MTAAEHSAALLAVQYVAVQYRTVQYRTVQYTIYHNAELSTFKIQCVIVQ